MRIGIDLGGSKIEGAALDRAGRVAVRRRTPTPSGDYDATVAAVRDLARGIEAEIGEACSVGVGMPGAISPATGLVKNANSTWLNGRRFDRDVAAALGREVRFANDANCFALSEAVDGAGRGAKSVFGVILGTGVGGGFVIDRRPVTGANAIAGEWGHLPLPWPADDERPGPLCYCGRFGCIETFLSGPALARERRRARCGNRGRRGGRGLGSGRCRPRALRGAPGARTGDGDRPARPGRDRARRRPRPDRAALRASAAPLGPPCLFRRGGDPAGAAGVGRFERRARRRVALGGRPGAQHEGFDKGSISSRRALMT